MLNIRNLFRKPDKWIAVDVELDGNRPSRIIQLSYLIIEGRRVHGKNFYFKAKSINRYARRVHGLGVYQLKQLSGGDIFAYHADEIYRDFQGCKLVIGHDVGGDLRYIRNEFARVGVHFPDYPIFCTLRHYTEEAHIPLKQNPKVLKPPKLVCRRNLSPASAGNGTAAAIIRTTPATTPRRPICACWWAKTRRESVQSYNSMTLIFRNSTDTILCYYLFAEMAGRKETSAISPVRKALFPCRSGGGKQ